MKTLTTLFTATLFSTSLLMGFASAKASELNIKFTDIERTTGKILVAIYDNETAYNQKSKPIKWARLNADAETVSLNFDDLHNGTYALMLIHDLNENGKMDFNEKGMPQDGYGFSNNVGMYGLPSFEAAAFELKDYASINVIVRKPVTF